MPSLSLLQPLLTGLSTGAFCLAYCLPFVAPVLAAEERTPQKNLALILYFLLGRFLGYAAFGLLFGYLGERFQGPFLNIVTDIALIGLSILLLLHMGRLISPAHKPCAGKTMGTLPAITMGFLLGVNICPPFLLALTSVISLHSALAGLVYFMIFFVGSSVYFAPLLLLGRFFHTEPLRVFARLCGIAAGYIVLLYAGASLATQLMTPQPYTPSTRQEQVLRNAASASPLHPALFAEERADGSVQCRLCPNLCVLRPGQFGQCKARKNINGILYSLVYGHIAAQHVDPIEKKPFFHVLPGAQVFSVATTGCNLQCLFCQNWDISQSFPEDIPTRRVSPEEVVAQSLASGAKAIAFTYSEPTIFYEYMRDIAKLAKAKGLRTLVVSNGYIEQQPLKELLPYIDAYKIDFKGFDEKFYADITHGHLQPVLDTMKTIKQSGVWLEIVTLLVTGQNDSDDQIRAMARWIRENLGPDVPLHFSRFFPLYKMLNVPATPEATVVRARTIAMEEGLKYVYTGNIAYSEGEITYCPESHEEAVIRQGMFTVANHLPDGTCADGEKIPGIWK